MSLAEKNRGENWYTVIVRSYLLIVRLEISQTNKCQHDLGMKWGLTNKTEIFTMHFCLLYKLMRSQFGFGISDRGSGDIKEVPSTTKKGVRKKPKSGHTQFNAYFLGG